MNNIVNCIMVSPGLSRVCDLFITLMLFIQYNKTKTNLPENVFWVLKFQKKNYSFSLTFLKYDTFNGNLTFLTIFWTQEPMLSRFGI